MAELLTSERLEPIVDPVDMDSLYVLPLSIIPLKTEVLKNARMLKSSTGEAFVEMFTSKTGGRGLVNIDNLVNVCEWESGAAHPDFLLLKRLAELPSYDIYSLRILLRKNHVDIDDLGVLQLSEDKQEELNEQMNRFTTPLLGNLYSEGEVNSYKDILEHFYSPDPKVVKKRLADLARNIGIETHEVPGFLQNFGDVFMSLAYYRDCHDRLTPLMNDFVAAVEEIRNNREISNNKQTMKVVNQVEKTMVELVRMVSFRFMELEKTLNTLWTEGNRERFREVREYVESYHTVIGSILCGVTLKMNVWAEKFPNPEVGGPMKRADFIVNDMRPGIGRLSKLKMLISPPKHETKKQA